MSYSLYVVREVNFKLRANAKNEYVSIKTLNHDKIELKLIIIKEKLEEGNISSKNRKANEDYFTPSADL